MSERNNTTLANEEKSVTEILELSCLSNIAILTLFGNCLVILAFIFGPRAIRTYTNYFVVNLAVSDLMVGCISLPFWILFRIDASLISDNVFNALIPLDILSGITSIVCLAAISLERMAAVKYTSAHFNLSKRPVIYAIFGTWLNGVILSTPKYVLPLRLLPIKIYTVSIFILGFLTPLSVIILSYCVIFYTSSHMMTPSNKEVSAAREIRVAKTISLIIGLFIICWTPFFTVNMVYVFCRQCDRPLWLIYVSKVMHYSNSMMNFFVYSARSPDFRTFFKKVLCPRRRQSVVGRRTTSRTERKYTTTSEISPFLSRSTDLGRHKVRSKTISVEMPIVRKRVPSASEMHSPNDIHFV